MDKDKDSLELVMAKVVVVLVGVSEVLMDGPSCGGGGSSGSSGGSGGSSDGTSSWDNDVDGESAITTESGRGTRGDGGSGGKDKESDGKLSIPPVVPVPSMEKDNKVLFQFEWS
jgi:hypothetical protein